MDTRTEQFFRSLKCVLQVRNQKLVGRKVFCVFLPTHVTRLLYRDKLHDAAKIGPKVMRLNAGYD